MRAGFWNHVAIACAASAIWAANACARPLTPAERRYYPYYAQMPECGTDSILSTVQSRFDQRESYYWKSGLEIERFERVRETGFRKTGLDTIPRRYCEARAVMNDRKVRTVRYAIGEDLNMTGGDAIRSLSQSFTFGLLPNLNLSPFDNWGVDWCVVGLDRNYAYGLNCSAARP